MTMIEAVREYIGTFEGFKGLKNIKVDFLAEESGSFSIEPIPINPVVEEYISGGGTYQYAFNVGGKFTYSKETIINIENSGFFEEFAKWIKSNNDKGIFPEVSEGQIAESIEITSNGYLFGITADMKQGRYQIPCLFIYEQEEVQ